MNSSWTTYTALLDEIALEGLRGITFDSLWIRLNDRDRYQQSIGESKLFTIDQDDKDGTLIHDYVWRVCRKESEKGTIQFYLSNDEQPIVQLYDRNQHTMEQTGTLLVDDSQIPDNLYPPVIGVKPNPSNEIVYGSCSDYYERLNITEKLLKDRDLQTFDDFQRKYSKQLRKIVVVASQQLRSAALLGPERWYEYKNVKPECYLILESIGTKRWYGEINFGKEAPRYLDRKMNASFYYYRKLLISQHLIIIIMTTLFKIKRNQISQAHVSYLPRFAPKSSHMLDVKMIRLSRLFRKQQTQCMSFNDEVLRSFMLEEFQIKVILIKVLRRIFERYSQFFRLIEHNNGDNTSDGATSSDTSNNGYRLEYLRSINDHLLDYEDFFQMNSSTSNMAGKDSKSNNASDDDDDDEDDNDQSDDPDNHHSNGNNHHNDLKVNQDDDDMNDLLMAIEDEYDDDDDDYDLVDQSKSSDRYFIDHLIDVDDDQDDPLSMINDYAPKFDYAKFFNGKTLIDDDQRSSFTEDDQCSIDDPMINSDDNESNEVTGTSSPTTQVVKRSETFKVKSMQSFICNNRFRRQFLTPNLQYHCISLNNNNNGEKLRLSLPKLQQIHIYLEDRILKFLSRYGPCSKKKMVKLFDLPINVIRLIVRNMQVTKKIVFTVKRIGRQSIHMFEAKFDQPIRNDNLSMVSNNRLLLSSTQSQLQQQQQIIDVVFQQRLQLILEYMSRLRICDGFVWIRRFIITKENNSANSKLNSNSSSSTLSNRIDVKSVIRLLNHLVDRNQLKLLHFSLNYNQHYRNSYYVIYLNGHNQSPLADNLVEHFRLRSRFVWFGRYPIDLLQDSVIKCVDRTGSNSDLNGKIDLNSNRSLLLGHTNHHNDSDDHHNDFDQSFQNDQTDLASEALEIMSNLQYCPSISAHYYQCHHSKLDKIFDLYRFLFYILIDDNNGGDLRSLDKENNVQDVCDRPDENEWQKNVPKLPFLQQSFSIVDILPYVPLTIYRNIVTIRFKIPELHGYLNDPLKKNLTLAQIPPIMRSYLLQNRRAPIDLIDSLQLLQQMGLVTLLLEDFETKYLDKKISFRYRYRLNRFLLIKKYSNDNDHLNVTEDESSMIEYYFNNLNDFDRFVATVYDHLCENHQLKSADNSVCDRCLFDAEQINIHQLNMNSNQSRYYANAMKRYEDKCSKQLIHRRKRKQNLSEFKRKRIRVEKVSTSKSLAVKIPLKTLDDNVNIESNTVKKSKKSSGIRIQWSYDEDCFLLRCRLLSELLDVPYTRRFLVHSQKIIESMIRYCGRQSKNKTAGSCIHRIVRLMQQKHIKRILMICKMELQSNFNSWLQELQENKDGPADDKLDKDQLFIQLLPRIVSYQFLDTEYFISNTGPMEQISADMPPRYDRSLTFDDIRSQYDIIDPELSDAEEYYQDIKNYYDIHGYLITNVLISSLFSFHLHYFSQNKNNRTNGNDTNRIIQQKYCSSTEKYIKRIYLRTIFRGTFKKFPQNLVKLIIKRMIRYRLISYNKRLISRSSTSNSNSNDVAKYSKSFAYCAYKLTQQFYRPLLCNYHNYDMKFQQIMDNDQSISTIIIDNNNTIINSLQFVENICCNALNSSSGTIDNQSIIDKSSIPDHHQHQQQPQENQLIPLQMLNEIRFPIQIPENFISYKRSDKTINNNNRSSLPSRTNARGMIMLNRTMNQNLSTITDDEDRRQSMSKQNTSSSIADEMSVIHCNVQIEQKYSSTNHQILSINNRIHCMYEKFLYHFRIRSQIFDQNSIHHSTEQLKVYEEKLSTSYRIDNGLFIHELLQFIRIRKEFGRTAEEISIFFQQNSIDSIDNESNIIDFLFDCQHYRLLFGVGIRQRIWIHYEYLRYWLVQSCRNLDLNVDNLFQLSRCSLKRMINCYFIPCVWKYPNGTVNIQILFLLFTTIIDYLSIDSNQTFGMTFEQLRQQFHRNLSPVQLWELLHYLLSFDCIRRTPITLNHNKNNVQYLFEDHMNQITNFDDFFSAKSIQINDDHHEHEQALNDDVNEFIMSNNYNNDDNYYYESTIDSYTKLTILYQIMKRLYPPWSNDD